MIWTFIFGVIVTLLNLITAFFPTVTELPFGIDAILVTGIGGIYALSDVFPILGNVLNAFIFYLGFRVLLKVFKVIPFFGKVIHD